MIQCMNSNENTSNVECDVGAENRAGDNLTRNKHGGNGLRGFQKVHISPLEGFTVVSL